jgi:hypothetical protein
LDIARSSRHYRRDRISRAPVHSRIFAQAMKASLELWKITLAWGCLIVFFGSPFILIGLHFLHMAGAAKADLKGTPFVQEFRYLGEYLKTVTAVIISLAGFNTVELFRRPSAEPTNHIITK